MNQNETAPKKRTGAVYQQIRKQQRRAAGLCDRCPNDRPPQPPAPGGYTACRQCLDQSAQYRRDRLLRKQTKGLCRECDQPTAPGNASYCAKHLEIARQSRLKYGRDLCRACRKPIMDQQRSGRCEKCHAAGMAALAAKRQQARLERIREQQEKSLCPRCLKQPTAPNRKRCESCLAYARAYQTRRKKQLAARTETS